MLKVREIGVAGRELGTIDRESTLWYDGHEVRTSSRVIIVCEDERKFKSKKK